MNARLLSLSLVLAIPLAACTTEPEDDGGPITIEVEQALTGQTTSAGTFRMAGALADRGATTEELTFGGPLDQSPVPVTFRRTLTGEDGGLVVTGSASLAFTSPTAATLSGTWQVESATGRYTGMKGTGTLTGSANFGVTPPIASIAYAGTINR